MGDGNSRRSFIQFIDEQTWEVTSDGAVRTDAVGPVPEFQAFDDEEEE